MRKTGLVRVRMWLRVEYIQLVFILTIPNDTRKSIFFTREWNNSFLRLWSYQNVAKIHTWCMILVVMTRCLSGRQNFVKIWQLVWFEWAKKCYGILKKKEFRDERLLVSGVNAQNNKYHRKMRLCFIRDDESTWEIPVHAN